MESVGVCSDTLVLTSMKGYAFRNSTEIKTCLTIDGMCSPDHAAAAAVWERDTVSSVGLFSGSSILNHQRPPTHTDTSASTLREKPVFLGFILCATPPLLQFLFFFRRQYHKDNFFCKLYFWKMSENNFKNVSFTVFLCLVFQNLTIPVYEGHSHFN